MNKKQDVFTIIASLHSETKIILLHSIIFSEDKLNVNSLVQKTGFERTNVSKQLKDLVNVGLIISEQIGRERFYSFDSSISQKKKDMIMSILDAYQECDCSNGKICK